MVKEIKANDFLLNKKPKLTNHHIHNHDYKCLQTTPHYIIIKK